MMTGMVRIGENFYKLFKNLFTEMQKCQHLPWNIKMSKCVPCSRSHIVQFIMEGGRLFLIYIQSTPVNMTSSVPDILVIITGCHNINHITNKVKFINKMITKQVLHNHQEFANSQIIFFSACVVSCRCRLFLGGVGSGDVGSGDRKIDMFVSDVSARGSVSDIMNKRCKRLNLFEDQNV